MSTVALLVVAIAVLPAFGLAAWVWLTLASETEEVGSFAGFDGMQLENSTGYRTRAGMDRRREFRSTRRIG